ncbi:MAG: 4-hydroxy-tetrahydrodipicolinate synthase [Tannerella sp.]|jgi:4-hydroxy-tetrahydrodipicolinate synthase|nr:4-hydroxy-tetrahydrodipicolinate synthase [Tannerella sp.]
MASIDLHGMGVALITPFKDDESVDYDALTRMIDHLTENGTDYIVALGTTAETPALSESEKQEITGIIVERVNRRIPVVLGIGGNCTRQIVSQIKTINLNGIDAILSVVPYYNKPSQEGIYQHFKAIAGVSPRPVVLYNVPGRCGANMTAETTLRLVHEFDNITAIKEASGNIAQIDDIIKNKPSEFQVISGDDGITFPLIALGAAGVISVIGNAFPKEFSRMVRMALQGDYPNARIIHSRFAELFKLLSVDGNPAGVKSVLNMMGFIENRLRLPLVPTRITTFEKIRDVLHKLNIIPPESSV